MLTVGSSAFAQSVGIGTQSPHSSAILDITSGSKGVLLPQTWLFNVDSSSPIQSYRDYSNDYTPFGLLVYNYNPATTNGLQGKGFYWWNGYRWHKLADQGFSWKTNGNALAGDGAKLGSLDDLGMGFLRNGKHSGRLSDYVTIFGYSNSRDSYSPSSMTIFGAESLLKPAGSSTSAFGAYSLQVDSTGSSNTAIGAFALALKKKGSYNTAIGSHALYNNQGSNNTAIGSKALYSTTTGNYNTGVGHNAVAAATISYATAIGADATVNCSNCMALGGMGVAAVKVGIGTATPSADLDIKQQADSFGIRLKSALASFGWSTYVDNSGNYVFQKGNTIMSYIDGATGNIILVSDSSRKKAIRPMPEVMDHMMQLQPKTYSYTHDATRNRTLGFLAQDVEHIFPEFVATGGNGYKAVGYANFGIVAIKAIQEQQELMQQQDELIAKLKKRIAALEKAADEK